MPRHECRRRSSISSAGTSTRKARSRRSAASPMRSTPNASRCAKRWATARRIFRLPTTTPAKARNGCTGAARMTSLTDCGDWREHIVLTQHRYMLEDVRIGLSFLVSVAATSPASRRRWHARSSRSAARCAARISWRPADAARWGSADLDRARCNVAARGLSHDATTRSPVLARGRMGRGIAVVFAYAGHEVALVDFKPRDAPAFEQASRRGAGRSPQRAEQPCALRPVRRSARGERLPPACRSCRKAKPAAALSSAARHLRGRAGSARAQARSARARLELAGPAPIIASTTSTILVDDLSSAVEHPERFLNAHWLNPAYPGAAGRALARQATPIRRSPRA